MRLFWPLAPLWLASNFSIPAAHQLGIVWFDLGHRVVARIAESRLSPAAKAAVSDLLAGQSMADASVWADDIRAVRRETAPWHYVNIPLAATRYDSATQCIPSCIISAIAANRRTLADPSAASIDKADALKFLIHFVGDLHQPLHVSDHDDRGGNLTPVTFFGASANLHQVWDGKLIDERGYSEDGYLAHLEAIMASLDLKKFAEGSVVDWALEGHRLAARYGYHLPTNHDFGEQDETQDLAVVDTAIIKAGVRLASVLNDALASYRAAPVPRSAAGTISDREAAAHAGMEATVVATVVSVHRSTSGTIHINFGADFPHQTFSVYIDQSAAPAFDGIDSIAGQRVAVRGVIRLYQGSAEIKVTRREQIEAVPPPKR